MKYYIHIYNPDSDNPGEYFELTSVTESSLANPGNLRRTFARALGETDWPLAVGDIIKLVEDEDV